MLFIFYRSHPLVLDHLVMVFFLLSPFPICVCLQVTSETRSVITIPLAFKGGFKYVTWQEFIYMYICIFVSFLSHYLRFFFSTSPRYLFFSFVPRLYNVPHIKLIFEDFPSTSSFFFYFSSFIATLKAHTHCSLCSCCVLSSPPLLKKKNSFFFPYRRLFFFPLRCCCCLLQ